MWLTRDLSLYWIYGFLSVIVLLLCFLSYFYNKVVRPLNSIGNGMELLREQDFSSRLSRVGQREADRIVDVFNRMMEQLKNERLRLREQNSFLDLLIQASPMGVVILTLDEVVSHCNPMALRMLGLKDGYATGKRLENIDSPLAVELSALRMDQTKMVRLSDASIYKCTYSSFMDCGFKHPFYLIERMTDEMMQAEKRSYEKVIRMIAHEVNNTTAGITSTLDTVSQTLADDPGMDDVCHVMKVCMERCYSMSRFITRFADVVKIPEPTLTLADLNELAATAASFMEGLCADHGIALVLDTDNELQPVRLDVSLFEQVLVNIIKNAAESIYTAQGEGRPSGRVVVRTLKPALIEVEDNGPGIARELESKLFTPFFSTKPNGQGIGLMFIREVLTRHGCAFSLRTYDDGLTRFRIRF